MKKRTLLLVYSLFAVAAFSQQNADTLQQKGHDYMRKGDWGNAIMVFNRALQQKPNDTTLNAACSTTSPILIFYNEILLKRWKPSSP